MAATGGLALWQKAALAAGVLIAINMAKTLILASLNLAVFLGLVYLFFFADTEELVRSARESTESALEDPMGTAQAIFDKYRMREEEEE